MPPEKLIGYLLSLTHPRGRTKAAFFLRFDFTAATWEVLAEALRGHAASHDIVKAEQTPLGMRYIVEGAMLAPDGRRPVIRSVWFIDAGGALPRFITAYPLPRRVL